MMGSRAWSIWYIYFYHYYVPRAFYLNHWYNQYKVYHFSDFLEHTYTTYIIYGGRYCTIDRTMTFELVFSL